MKMMKKKIIINQQHITLYVCMRSTLNWARAAKCFCFPKLFGMFIVHSCKHTQTHTHMYPSPVGFLVALRHVSSGYIFVIITIIIDVVVAATAADVVVVRACQFTSKFALQIPLLPLLLWPVLFLLLIFLLIKLSHFTEVVYGISKQKPNNFTAAIHKLSSKHDAKCGIFIYKKNRSVCL